MLDFSEISGVPAGQSGSSEQRDSDGFITLRRKNPDSPNAPISEPRDADGFVTLKKRAPDDDPMQLEREVMAELKHIFKKNGVRFFEGQYEAVQRINQLVLEAKPNSITAIPLVPGGGKSTYIAALLRVLAKHFANIHDDPIAQRVGGVVVIVESSIEAHQHEDLCKKAGGDDIVAVVESVNDSNLRQFGCPIGKAESRSDCPGRGCTNYANCKLAQSAFRLNETPILIMLQARYKLYLEDMSQFAIWYDKQGEEHPRTLLLVDELPDLFQSNELSLESLRKAEADFEKMFTPRSRVDRDKLLTLHERWEWTVRVPFIKLAKNMAGSKNAYGFVTSDDYQNAGFNIERLKNLRKELSARLTDCTAMSVIDTVLTGKTGLFSNDRSFSVTMPRLKKFDKRSGFATVVFSGTAQLAPELRCSGATVVDCPMPESYTRLRIIVQRGDGVSASRSGLSNEKNIEAVAAWVQEILSSKMDKKALVATYKPFSVSLWNALGRAQDRATPYTDRTGREESQLPYFGGMTGSNVYSTATCVICAGLNRFQPHEYLDRYLAMNSDADTLMDELERGLTSLAAATPVMDLQDIYLAADIIQLVFRSALRLHGQDTPITLWLFQPPNGVVGHLQEFFGDCQIQEIPNLPESCHTAATTNHQYAGKRTHAGLLLEYLTTTNASQITPADIRSATGLTMTQFKEGMKSRTVKNYMAQHFLTSGSGKNTVYYKCAA